VKQVTIVREGKSRIVVPTDSLWDDFFDSPGVDLGERSDPPIQAREAL
jgi:antitoxin VapB